MSDWSRLWGQCGARQGVMVAVEVLLGYTLARTFQPNLNPSPTKP